MMVPRSYMHLSRAPMASMNDDEKAVQSATSRDHIPLKGARKNGKGTKASMPQNPFSPPPATASRPVVIPTKTRDGSRRKSKDVLSNGKERILSTDSENVHNASSTLPSVAAFAAIRSLPEVTNDVSLLGRRKGPSRDTRKEYQECQHPSISASSPRSWGMLLRPPDEIDEASSSFESNTTLGPVASLRSMSTESMPSLGTDTESLGSASNPSTPGMALSNRRHKNISTSVGEDCLLDHPLLPQAHPAAPEMDEEIPVTLSTTPSAAARLGSSFKSNLTASLRKVRSAAKSITNFTTPPNHREDALARSLFAPQYVDEKRPKISVDLPDPALRRYLNPITLSPSEFHYHSERQKSQAPHTNCTTSIQMQTYQRRHKITDKATSPPIFASSQQQVMDEVDGLPQILLSRQREPRENSDFLRVIVMEMNIRRAGLWEDDKTARARIWLPARQVGKMVDLEPQGDGRKKVPARWAGTTA